MQNIISKEAKIAVLCGGMSSEREISLRSGKNVLAALQRLGYQNAQIVDVSENIMNDLKGFEYAYNTLHGKFGEDGCIQGVLEILKIPYTGCGVMASAICMNKEYTKKVMSTAGLPLITSVYLLPNEDPVESVVAQIEEIGKASEETLIEVEKVNVVQSGDVVEENEEVVDDSNEIQELENNISTEETQNDDAVIEVVEKEIEKEYRRHTRNGYISGFLTALLLFVIFIFIWKFFIDNEKGFSLSFSSFNLSSLIEQNSDIDTESDNISKNNADISVVNPIDSIGDVKAEDVIKSEVVDSISVVENVTPKEPIVETITRGKFLTTIANKYYGDKVFWVYIYRENKIWNPKDLQPGDKVVVPDASKYDIDASNPESIKKAKALEQQILYEIE